jgi:1-acyl-sn-glycerol-3-phosphate acyltransferase
MTWTVNVVNVTIKHLMRLICQIDDSQLARVPEQGPLILVSNHVNFLEVPVVLTHLHPRPVTGFAKVETWDNRVLGVLFSLWEAIPLQRGEADVAAIRHAIKALEQGKILAVAPEGTRSGDGQLQAGYPGIVLLGLRTGVPLLPLVYYGGESFKKNIRTLRRTDFQIVVGNPFTLDTGGVKVTREIRQRMTDEIMYQLAALLPHAYRGRYSNLTEATENYLHFAPQVVSNLSLAQHWGPML